MEYNRIAVRIFNTNTSFEGIKIFNFDIFHCTQQAPHHYDFDFAAKSAKLLFRRFSRALCVT